MKILFLTVLMLSMAVVVSTYDNGFLPFWRKGPDPGNVGHPQPCWCLEAEEPCDPFGVCKTADESQPQSYDKLPVKPISPADCWCMYVSYNCNAHLASICDRIGGRPTSRIAMFNDDFRK